jgi:hypothetical protein
MTFDESRNHVLRSVEDIGKEFTKPDDDWLATLLLHNADGLQIVPVHFQSVQEKDNFVKVVMGLFRHFKPHFASMVTSAWMRKVDAKGPMADLAVQMAGRFGVGSDPHKEEIVMVTCADPTIHEVWTAPILRTKDKPPRLGTWKNLDAEVTGRMGDLLARAFEAM